MDGMLEIIKGKDYNCIVEGVKAKDLANIEDLDLLTVLSIDTFTAYSLSITTNKDNEYVFVVKKIHLNCKGGAERRTEKILYGELHEVEHIVNQIIL